MILINIEMTYLVRCQSFTKTHSRNTILGFTCIIISIPANVGKLFKKKNLEFDSHQILYKAQHRYLFRDRQFYKVELATNLNQRR